MLYVRAIDDAAFTHATANIGSATPICNAPTGRIRLDLDETHEYDALSGTSILRRSPATVSRPQDVTCPRCASALAPEKIRPASAPAKKKSAPAQAPRKPRARKAPPA